MEIRCIVLIQLCMQSVCFLLYNATLFVTVASSRAEILPLCGGGVRKEMYQIWSQQNNSVVLIEIIICDAVLIWLNGGVPSNAFCVAETIFWHISYLTLPPQKGNIAGLKQAMVTNEVAL